MCPFIMAGATIPTTDNNQAVQLTPAKTALAVTVDSTISSSTEITLNVATTFLRVYAADKDVYMRWGTSDVTASTFDEIIPANQICDFYIPRNITAVNFIERAASAFLVVIEK